MLVSVRQQGYITCPLDSRRQLPLVLGLGAGIVADIEIKRVVPDPVGIGALDHGIVPPGTQVRGDLGVVPGAVVAGDGIGRVEVRATPPAPAPKKQRSKPPAMSLDEYLRQRAGGDRR